MSLKIPSLALVARYIFTSSTLLASTIPLVSFARVNLKSPFLPVNKNKVDMLADSTAKKEARKKRDEVAQVIFRLYIVFG